MSTVFTYNLGSNDPDLVKVSLIRLNIQDHIRDQGVKPGGTNFTDEEILALLTLEGGDTDGVVQRLYGILAAMWSQKVDVSAGPRSEKLSQVSANYARLAGGGKAATDTAGYSGGSVMQPQKLDGYSR